MKFSFTLYVKENSYILLLILPSHRNTLPDSTKHLVLRIRYQGGLKFFLMDW